MPIDFKLIAEPSILAIEFLSLDAVQFVSPRGSDSDDGLSGGNAKLTLQAAHDALPASGGTIFCLAGTITGATSITKNVDVVLHPLSVLTIANNVNKPVVIFQPSVTRGSISGGTIDGNAANNTVNGADSNSGIVVYGSNVNTDRVTIQNCFARCVNISSGASKCSVTRCRLLSSNIAVVLVSNVVDCEIGDNEVDGCAYGIWCYDNALGQPCQRIRIHDNEIHNLTGTSTVLAEAAAIAVTGCFSVTVADNICIDNPGTRGIYTLGNTSSITITGNHCTRNGTANALAGMDIDLTTNVVCTGNHSVTNGGYGVYLGGVRNSVVSANTVLNNCQNAGARTAGGGAGAGIVLNEGIGDGSQPVNANTIVGNVSSDYQGTPTQEYGIREWIGLASYYNSNAIVGNVCKGNSVQAIHTVVGTTDVVANNVTA